MTDGMGIGRIGIGGVGAGTVTQRTAGPAEAQKSFKAMVLENIEKADKLQKEAEAAMSRVQGGHTDGVREALAAAAKAEVAFQTLMQIRDRLMAAYQEINEMRF